MSCECSRFDINDFSTDQLREELEARGLLVVDFDESDNELIKEMEARGFSVLEDGMDVLGDINRLCLDYQLTGPDFFKRQLRDFFSKYTGKTFV